MLGGRLKNFLTSGGRKQNVARDLAAFLGVLKEHFKKIRPREGEKNKVNSLKWISFQAWVTRLLFFFVPPFFLHCTGPACACAAPSSPPR